MTTILTVVDRFLKMAHFIALPKLLLGQGDSKGFGKPNFQAAWPSRIIITDHGPQFTAKFWAEFFRLLCIFNSLSLGFHSQTNRQSERLNQELETGLRILSYHESSSWGKHLVWIEYVHNSLPSVAMGLTPFQTVLGYQPSLFSNQDGEAQVPSTHAFVYLCHLAWRRTHQTLLSTIQSNE